jgi:hypothetical protein
VATPTGKGRRHGSGAATQDRIATACGPAMTAGAATRIDKAAKL